MTLGDAAISIAALVEEAKRHPDDSGKDVSARREIANQLYDAAAALRGRIWHLDDEKDATSLSNMTYAVADQIAKGGRLAPINWTVPTFAEGRWPLNIG